MDLSLALLGGLAAAMALDAAPDPEPPAPKDDTACEQAEPIQDKHAKPSCKRDPNTVDGLTIEGKRGATQSPLEPEMTFDEDAIRAMGASTIAEIMVQMEPMTRGLRGRADEPPVVLINGQRTTGMHETGSIPEGALKKIDVLSEEAALAYGFRADQRVLNFTLKKDYRATTLRTEGSRATQGGRGGTDQRASIFKVDDKGRWTAEVRYHRESPLYETERDVAREVSATLPYDVQGNVIATSGEIDPALSALAGSTISTAAVPASAADGRPALSDFLAGAGRVSGDDLTLSRTLMPRTEEGSVQGGYTRNFGKNTATISGGLEDASRIGYRGLTGAMIPIAAGSPFSPFARDVLLYRHFGDANGLRNRTDTSRLNLGAVALGMWSGWRWTFTGQLERMETDSRIGQGVDVSAFRAAVAAGDPAVNPFGPVPPALLGSVREDTANATITNIKTDLTLAGTLAELPTGALRATVRGGLDRRRAESQSIRSGVHDQRVLTRDRATLNSSIDMPILSARNKALGKLGDMSLNGNVTYEQFSDLGGLITAGGGLTWKPRKGLSLTANYSVEEGEAALDRLNDPVLQTPNAWTYDYTTGNSVNVTVISGGNPQLSNDNRRLLKLGLNYKPFPKRDLTLNVNYVGSRIDDQIASLPTISPELEAAFPERFKRDAAGRLAQIDIRPVNFAYEDKQELSWGFRYARQLGATPPAPPPKPPPAAKGGAIAITPTPPRGYISLQLDHIWRLRDEVVIRRGMAPLNLLDGASLGRRGGTPRHEVTLTSYAFHKGLGGWARGSWKSGTWVDGGARGEDLTFSALPVLYLQAFVDFGNRGALAKDVKWLSDTRLMLNIDNVFETSQRVRDSQGRTPQAYQPAFMDPYGRTVRLSLRKRF